MSVVSSKLRYMFDDKTIQLLDYRANFDYPSCA